jgi:hypothetical protein
MNRIRGGAILLAGILLLAAGGTARAQDITGRITGRVVDQDTSAPLAGVTVIVVGPQGEDATITDEKGDYLFNSLPVGTYLLRFYAANTAATVEQSGVVVAADKTLRVNQKIAGSALATPQHTTVITGRAPAVDVGSARVGATFNQDYMLRLPNGRTFGDILERTPGAFVDGSGNVAIGGATGPENIYTVNGLNVTGIEYGNLESGAATLGGGTNLPLEFLTQVDVASGGFEAEWGGAMGGVISTVLKSGGNEVHGSAFTLWAPYWLASGPNPVYSVNSSIGSKLMPDFDTSIGVEVGGPIIKDKLFWWVGFAPRFSQNHVFRLTYAQTEDPNNPGQALADASGNPLLHELTDWRARIDQTRQTYAYAATIDFVPTPDHHLTLAAFGTPSYGGGLRNVFAGADIASSPSWAREQLTKTDSDVTAHWTSELFDRRWKIEALAGWHYEYYYDRSPDAALNSVNQLEYWGSNLWDLEHAPGCEPDAVTGFQPCPVNPYYHTGGFGLVKQATGNRWAGDLKSTHLIDLGGRHELKYGWHVEFANFDQNRFYSGPPGSRVLVQVAPNGGQPAGAPYPYFDTYSFFSLQPGQFPSDFFGRGSDLLYPPDYQDQLHAYVKSLSNAFFLQDGYSPSVLPNLTVNAGARLELQKMYDRYGGAFLDANNLGPRFGAVYDPFNDGRSKISVAYGRYFEAIPLNLAARYFGGEGILIRNGVPLSTCQQQNPYAWQGAGEWRNCALAPQGMGASDVAAGNTSQVNNGSDYPLQSHLQGQFHNEIVATIEREVMDDLTVRLDYQYRWLGTIVEDGAGDPTLTFVLANPGDVPKEALQDAQNEYNTYQTAADNYAAAAAANPNDPRLAADATRLASAAANAKAKLTTLQTLSTAPKPERTYQALSLSVNKRFSKNWMMRGSYTYSRLFGNYEGLYQNEQNYFAPNGNNAYDTPDLYVNQRGPLPNDRPHLGRIDGYYTHAVGSGSVTFALGFSARSGIPRNYVGALIPNQQLVMILPRGSAGRTPPVTQFDGRISYARPLTATTSFEAFVDLFNLLNQQATLADDDNYTFDMIAPIQGGTTQDLKFAKNAFGAPINKNANFGHPIAYQAPFHGRLGLRLNF